MKIIKTAIIIVISAALLATVGITAYNFGKDQPNEKEEELKKQIEELKAKEADAAVVKRVSQQMENIAYQQKAVSDLQRERAEMQSELAIRMRDQAEMESRLAREAENKANDAAEEADRQRSKALEHQKMAEEQRDEATRAKNVTDTLNYRSLGRTLGNSAITQYENSHKGLAGVLAYASWYYLNKYDGNTYQPETYKAISLCSNSRSESVMQKNGAVNATYPLGNGACVAVSNYGEIEWQKNAGHSGTVLLQNRAYDFRDVYANNSKIYALSFGGDLVVTGYDRSTSVFHLPGKAYIKVLLTGANTLTLIARHSYCTFDINSLMVSAPTELKGEVSAATVRGNITDIFFSDGSHATIDKTGKLEYSDFPVKNKITAAYYDKASMSLYLGLENGDIAMVNRFMRTVTLLSGHISRITSISSVGQILITGAYDKSVMIWNLPRLQFESGMSLQEELNSPMALTSKKSNKNSTKSEWLTPIDIKFSGWPLCISTVSETDIVIGTSLGIVCRLNTSVSDMAERLKKAFRRNLTTEEWNHYVGTSIPYETF